MPTFDVVSKVNTHEVDNAVMQTQKEVGQRFDFRETGTSVEKTSEGFVIVSSSEARLEAAYEVLRVKLVKRGVSLKHLDPQKVTPANKGTYRRLIKIKEGIDRDNARLVLDVIKNSKLKVQGSIHEDTVRVSGKHRDDLQAVIQALRAQEMPFDMQFINFRE